MKQPDETKKKTAAPADGAEAPEAETALPDAATEDVSGGSRLPRGSESLLFKHALASR
jgi:hypothetical protein